ncbi:recombinase family protein [Acetivibrio ethanolgignens]|uniref:Resolvase/invertase-type recombinase catalytic domain-containing protein n=1 Tax=Acetivibrio ethanolgignens TaxID=290052 RepID=A0A0V8QEE9_9FIRM|nr:recombinase family protein [Acetivibrio ethanolgignens]KSV58930.1 hypothetical protein ASU35_10925 [Acetivibrio ethanolgignens]
MKTAAVYIRVSTDKQEELSPESQLDKVMEYAKSNGYYIPKEYISWSLVSPAVKQISVLSSYL